MWQRGRRIRGYGDVIIKGKKWTEEEVKILAEKYPEEGVNIDELNRSKKSIEHKARRIGITDGDRSFLKEYNPKIRPKSCVYVVEAENDLYKIGSSSSVIGRIERINMLSPIGIQLRHVIYTDDNKELEKRFHEKFSEKRVKGEWFDLDDDDLEMMETW